MGLKGTKNRQTRLYQSQISYSNELRWNYGTFSKTG